MLDSLLSWFGALPWWVILIIVVGAFYGAGLLLTVLARAGEMLLAHLAFWGDELAHWLSERISAAVIAGLRGLGRAIAVLLGYLIWPLTWLWRAVADWASGVLTGLQDWLDEDKGLRALWQKDYRDQFKTFKEFKEAFHHGYGPQSNDGEESRSGDSAFRKAPDEPDPFAYACRVIGLPDTGAFTKEELDQKWHRYMSVVHEDKKGSKELATLINTSRDLIKKQKGWK
ncbi:MAG: hypothetical protein IH606_16605 [Burkholderiales bacterium]|nr:hypothetical protein [Burkholderiales bacterium]